MMTAPAHLARDDPDDGWSLPAWTYRDAEYHHVEMARVFRPSWQIVCHVSDVASPGAWHSLDFLGESILVVRDRDGALGAFANVCRHRGARLCDGTQGSAERLVCPYHAWTYALDGRLIGVPGRAGYDPAALAGLGLPRFDLEVFAGFVFVRLADDGGPSVADMMAPYAHEIAPYRFAEMRALGRVTLRPRAVNWKNIADNYSDALHIQVAHPGLKRLMGDGYGVEAAEWVDKMWGELVARPSFNPSERAYCALLPEVGHLPPERRRLWTYFKLWPNIAFDIYPDQVDFMQFLPVSPTQTLIREISYALPDGDMPERWRREMRAARYLNWRINRQVNAEDTDLVARVQAGMASASFTVGPLSREEVSLRRFARRIRGLVPEARNHAPPAPGWSMGR